ncbi:MAG: hypothetical protein JO020_14785 [Chloroflexi bacterium]|nr:hypothetical protein [Chloroflexota bacterium]MBV9133742.1 hypothetical protein [Chloroflexota bacterium]MBV9895427.1 hypothetical protein [Chloroflexota bacterium]
MVVRLLLVLCCVFAFGLSACGGGPKAQTADLAAIHQPTPDPTLDAVVRDLPRTLAGVAPTDTPTPKPIVVRQPPAPVPTRPAAPTPKPAPPKPTATPSRR